MSEKRGGKRKDMHAAGNGRRRARGGQKPIAGFDSPHLDAVEAYVVEVSRPAAAELEVLARASDEFAVADHVAQPLREPEAAAHEVFSEHPMTQSGNVSSLHPAPAAPAVAAAPAMVRATGARFNIFIIDTGWQSPASRVVHENFGLIAKLAPEDQIFVLSPEQSIEFVQQDRTLIGKDPLIMVHDLAARSPPRKVPFHGFRIHLGLASTPADALAMLQEFTRFIALHRDSSTLERDVQKRLRRAGIRDTIALLAKF